MDQKEAILKAGLELFSTRSYASTGIREITRRVGVPTGSFHYYFKNKEDFALGVLDYFFEEEFMSKGNDLLFDNELSAKEKLIKSFRLMIDYHIANSNPEDAVSSCVMGNLAQEISGHSKAVSAKISTFYAKTAFAIQSLIEMGLNDQSISTHLKPEELARFLFDAYEGALIRRKISGTNEPVEAYLKILEQLL